MKTKTYLLLLALCFFAHCCTEEPDTLPPITTTGENTFGCLVDGEVFLGNWHGMFTDPVGGEIVGDTLFYVNGYGKKSIVRLGIKVPDLQIMINYKLNNNYPDYGKYSLRNTNDEFITDSIRTGELTLIKIDTVHYIVSGTFWFDAVNKEGKKVEIRDGRFDIIY